MDRYEETFETWDKVASLYQEKFMQLDLYNETYASFCDAITRSDAYILEIGCGPGNITKYLLNKNSCFQILGIDIAPNMIALAQKNNPSARFTVMDVRNIHTIRSTFDGIIGGFCLPYLSHRDVQKLITDCSTLLNHKGLIYLSFIEGAPLQSDFQTGSSGDRVFFYFHQLETLVQQLSKSNFNVLKTFVVDYKRNEQSIEQHTILIAQKNDHNI